MKPFQLLLCTTLHLRHQSGQHKHPLCNKKQSINFQTRPKIVIYSLVPESILSFLFLSVAVQLAKEFAHVTQPLPGKTHNY